MIIGIDIGGTKTSIGLSYTGHELKDSIEFATPANQRKLISVLTKEIINFVGSQQLDAIGISCPGPLNKKRGMVTNPHHLPWLNLRLTQPMKRRFNCPVILEHDATAGGIYEARFGAGKTYKLVSYITISTGIGNSLLLDGQPIANSNNPEGGSQIIDFKKVGADDEARYSALASGLAIERDFGAKPSDIYDKNIWQEIAQLMSYGIYNIIQISAPDVVILGGGVASHYKRFGKYLNKDLRNLNPVYKLPPVIMASQPNIAPLRGVIYLAAQKLDV
jgi:glucokinase